MENNITEIQAAFKEQLNKDILQVLKSWDSADPSEYNVFSARRSMKEYLLKNQPDEAKGYINFMRGLGVCGKLFNDIIRVGDKLEASNQSDLLPPSGQTRKSKRLSTTWATNI